MKQELQGWKLCRCTASGEAADGAAGSRCRAREDSRSDHDAAARREARPGGGTLAGLKSENPAGSNRNPQSGARGSCCGTCGARRRGLAHPLEAVLLLPGDEALARQLASPRWFRTETGKVPIEDKERLRRRGVKSPDRADALVLTFHEPPAPVYFVA